MRMRKPEDISADLKECTDIKETLMYLCRAFSAVDKEGLAYGEYAGVVREGVLEAIVDMVVSAVVGQEGGER